MPRKGPVIVYIVCLNSGKRQIYHVGEGVSKNSGTPKWIVYNGKPYKKMDDFRVPLFSETSKWDSHEKALHLFRCHVEVSKPLEFKIPAWMLNRCQWWRLCVDIFGQKGRYGMCSMYTYLHK